MKELHCRAMLEPASSAASEYLGQPIAIRHQKLSGKLLRPSVSDWPGALTPSATHLTFTTRPFLHVLYEEHGGGVIPWLYFDWRLSPPPPDLFLSHVREHWTCGPSFPIGRAYGQMVWDSPLTLRSCRITINKILMAQMIRKVGDPEGDASWLFSRLLTGLWPATIRTLYDDSRIESWVRLH